MSRSRVMQALGIACALAATSCAPDAKHLEWTVGFSTEALRTESAHVSAWIVRGGCNGNKRVYETDVSAAPNDRRSEALRPGVYGFGATATDASCMQIAEGCVELRVPSDTSVPIDIMLVESRGAALCPASQCVSGSCSEPVADAGSMADADTTNTCPDGVRRPGGHCYRYYNLTTDFSDARELCALWSADVIVLDDAAEETWAKSTLAPGGDYWIGITDQVTDGTWLTITGATPTYLNWDPADSAESNTANCARYFDMTAMWRDLPCSDEFRVICERP